MELRDQSAVDWTPASMPSGKIAYYSSIMWLVMADVFKKVPKWDVEQSKEGGLVGHLRYRYYQHPSSWPFPEGINGTLGTTGRAQGCLTAWLAPVPPPLRCTVQYLGHTDRPGVGTVQDSVILPNMHPFLHEEGRPI